MGDTIKNALSSVGEVVAPEIRTPSLPGMNVPQPATSPVDRYLPLLSALSSTIREGDPLSGFIRGREAQFGIQQSMSAPYVAQAAALEANRAKRQQLLEGLDADARRRNASPEVAGQLTRIREAVAAGLDPSAVKYLYPSPPKSPSNPTLLRAYSLAVQNGEDPTNPTVLGKYASLIDERESQQSLQRQVQFALLQDKLIRNRQAEEGLKPKGLGTYSLDKDRDKFAFQFAVQAGVPREVLQGPDGPIVLQDYMGQADQALLVRKMGGTVQDYSKNNVWRTKEGKPLAGMIPIIPALKDPDIQAVPLTKGDDERLMFYDGYLQSLSEIEPELAKMEKFFIDNPSLNVEFFGPAANAKTRQLVINKHPELEVLKSLMGTLDVAKAKLAFAGERLTDADREVVSGYAGNIGRDPAKIRERLNDIKNLFMAKRQELLRQDPYQMKLIYQRIEDASRQDPEGLPVRGSEATNPSPIPTPDINEMSVDEMKDLF